MWVDAARRVVIYQEHREKIAAICHDAIPLRGGLLAVPLHLGNVQRLRYHGVETPLILDPRCDYPRHPTIDKPFEAQVYTANFLASTPRAYCFNDMGTGKTLAALWAAHKVMAQYPKGQCRALIVAPLSTLQRVWGDAIFSNLLGQRTYAILHGSAEERLRRLAEPHDFYIINPEGLAIGAQEDNRGRLSFTGLSAALQARSDLRIAVVDEASAYKAYGTKRHKVGRAILSPRDYLWLLTGTPTPNGPLDAYGLARLMGGTSLKLRDWRERTMTQITQFKWLPKAGAQEAVKELLQPAIRYAIGDCVDLPPCTVQRRDVELSKAQKDALKRFKRDATVEIGKGQITAVNEAALRMKLIQISCGAVYDAAHEVHTLDAKPRLDVLKEVLEEASGKAIVFAPLTSVVEMLYKEIHSRWSAAIVNGSVPQGKRSEIFRAFMQEPSPRVLVADPGTMAHGLTLTAAATIVWYGPTDKTEVYLQANARINRPGQVKATTIVQLASTDVEREIFRRLQANESLQGVILKMVEDGR